MSAVLCCADPLAPGRVDPHFAAQAAAVREAGGTVALIDHDALLAGDAAGAVRRVPRDLGGAWYRGWMIPTARYGELCAALAARGVPMNVPVDDYRAAHELPGWHGAFAGLTPESVWTPWRPREVPDPGTVARLVAPLGGGPAVVKDYVKSRKYEWDEACYVPDLSDVAAATRVVARMVELQGDDLAGGIVVRRFERLARAEARVWWLDGAAVLTTAHPDTPAVAVAPDLTGVAAAVARLGRRFVTTDLALRDDGAWRVVEVGDAQVSDLPSGVDPAPLLGRLP
ncbi:ATP-grasp domain-containing protein [Luedemannella helvata]|uniref:ATP-grasp domain-containing protein n=1 Tax=Luedemannella helvata TaxID=349315 RepID=A0ABN2KBT4_9ACTN